MTDRTGPSSSERPDRLGTKIGAAVYLALIGIVMTVWIAFLGWLLWRFILGF
ncbi:hypothetical protein [Bosea sp. AS-1]|jgi:hypothetical protein|uniref:hypothetical protein n=1 Tax=Bosea sp. AS-1 TaxID=2015316 RepID=UPI0012FD95AA|nr:hypothetical protein [Bosea sp. AS-1]